MAFSGDGRLLFVSWLYEEWHTGQFTIDLVVYRSRDLKVVEVIKDPRLATVHAASTTGRYLAGGVIGTSYGTRHGQTVRYDRRTGALQLLTISPTGEPADAWSHSTDTSANGKTILFNTPAGNIAPEGDHPPVDNEDTKYNDLFIATLGPLR